MNKWLFGLDCPGCGMQRSIALLFDGQFANAFYMFPAIYTTILFVAGLALHLLDKSRNYTKFVIWCAILNGGIMIISYIYKITL